MRISLGHRYAAMPHQFLDIPERNLVLAQERSECVAQRVEVVLLIQTAATNILPEFLSQTLRFKLPAVFIGKNELGTRNLHSFLDYLKRHLVQSYDPSFAELHFIAGS